MAQAGGRWKASAAILAGGRSSRFGSDKAVTPVGGRPLIERIVEQLQSCFSEVLISCDDAGKFGVLGVPVVADPVPGCGPLMGIANALREAAYERVFVVACDIPVIEQGLVGRMIEAALDADCVVPVLDGRHPEPLFAVYCRRVLPVVDGLLREGSRAVRSIYARVKVDRIVVPDADWYVNLNTHAELLAYLRRVPPSREP
jgi:molybdopterin-guanine dinucleotide biosynthesis protein A